MTNDKKIELQQIIRNGSVAYGFDREQRTSKRVRLVIFERFHVEYNSNDVCEILSHLGRCYGNAVQQLPVVHSVKATKRPSITGKSTFGYVLKKQKIEDAILILWDENGFSLHPNRRLAWSDIDVTIILFAVCPKHRPRTAGVEPGGAVLASCEGRWLGQFDFS